MCLRLDHYLHVRHQTLALADPLSAEDTMGQSLPETSPVKWHLAHTSWFFETFLLGPAGCPPFHPKFNYLFNSYYDGLGPHLERPLRAMLTRPSLEEVRAYRQAVDEGMALAWEALPEPRVALGLNHEEQHQELILTDLKHLLYTNPLRPSYRPPGPKVTPLPRPMGWQSFAGGLVRLGHEGAGFAFDNESPAHRVFLSPYLLADRCVTQAEYLEFMLAGGYRQPQWWLADGWERLRQEGWQAPLYWEGAGQDWQVFTLEGMEGLDPHAPVRHVSFYEAAAFASWSQARLPTEAEWELAAQGQPGLEGGWAAGAEPAPSHLEGLFGEAWQWTASPYVAYPGFQPLQGTLGEYNGKFMANQFVLRGSSPFTPPGHARPTYRNFFPPQARWQASGIRLARDLRP